MIPGILRLLLRHKRLTRLGAAVWTLVILWLCTLSSKHIPHLPGGLPWDKLAHILLFGFFYGGWRLAFPTVKNRWPLFLVTVLYGFAIECIQLYATADRSFEWADVLADACGGLLALWMLYRVSATETAR